MTGPTATDRAELRLAEELSDNGIHLDADPAIARIVIQELDYARRAPTFEGRTPLYGSIVLHDGSLEVSGVGLDLVPAMSDLGAAREYADGRSSYLVRQPDRPLSLACFDRAIQYEADLVRLQEATGAQVIQRTPVFGVVRLFRRGTVVVWNGRSWLSHRTASTMLPAVQASAGIDAALARGLLELAVHWLSPGRVGATLVVHREDVDNASLETSRSEVPPPLSIRSRHHYAALLACLQQHDLATLIDSNGRVEAIGVGLVSSTAAQAAIPATTACGTAAQRWSFDHPSSVVVVVSEDGPVTVYLAGRILVG